MTTDIDFDKETDVYDHEPLEGDAYKPYRSVSKAGIMSVIFAILSLLALIVPALLVLPAMGLALGFLALRNMRTYPDELTGKVPTWVGIVGSGLLLVGGSTMHTVIYLTEVPEGYERITFSALQPASVLKKTGEPGLPTYLDGKRIFVKGYVHPGVSSLGNIKRFILVPDMGTCCFGGQPKLTDMIEVKLADPLSVRYSQRKRKLGGILRVKNQIRKVAGGLDGGYFELDADYVK